MTGAANLKSIPSIQRIADRAEQQRRDRLRRDLYRLADRLAVTDPAAAGLARHWAVVAC